MNNFRYLKFGIVPENFTQSDVQTAEQILISYVRLYQRGTVDTNVPLMLEVFNIAKRYIGPDFQSWVRVNYRSGIGSRRELSKYIKLWLERKTPGLFVIERVKIDLARSAVSVNNTEQLRQPILVDDLNANPTEEIDFSGITNEDMYHFFSLLGPDLLAKFCLNLNGIDYVN